MISHSYSCRVPGWHAPYPLIDVKFLREMSISNYLANEPTFTISFAFHCRAHNYTNYILKVAEYDKKHQ